MEGRGAQRLGIGYCIHLLQGTDPTNRIENPREMYRAFRAKMEARPHRNRERTSMSKMIAAERDLLNRLRAASRRILGPEASDTEVEARARRAYEGPKLPEVVLTPEEEEARERQFAENLAEADRAGVMDL